MTIQTICGFEAQSSNLLLGGDPFTATTGTVTYVTDPVRTGTYAMRCQATGTAIAYARIGAFGPNAGRIGAWAGGTGLANSYSRFYFRYPASGKPATASEPMCQINNTGSAMKMEVRLNSSNKLEVYSSTSTLNGTSTATLTADTWHMIEIYCGTGTAASWEVRINGATDLSGVMNLTTFNGGYIELGKSDNRNGQSIEFFYDDLIVDDTSHRGPGQVLTMSPDANGSTQQWTNGTGASDWQEVDEIPVSEADYIRSTAISQVALMGFESAASAGISGVIHAVQFASLCAQNTSGTADIGVRIRSGSTNNDTPSTADSSIPGARALHGRVANVDPATTNAWLTSGLDSIEAGVFEGTAGTVRARCFWMLISVSFTPEPAVGGTARAGTLGSTTYSASQTGKYAVITLENESGALVAGVTGIRWIWLDTPPTAWSILPSVVASGAGGTTDANGKFSVDVGLYTSLDIGDVGFLVITSNNNNPDQTPAGRSLAYSVQLSATP